MIASHIRMVGASRTFGRLATARTISPDGIHNYCSKEQEFSKCDH
jgi:hypothetical protein